LTPIDDRKARKMKNRVSSGKVILRNWDPVKGLIEQELSFGSIDDLFARCLEIGSGETVDRVVLDGVDSRGKPRRITLAFQSATVSEITDD
jgi:hypothetical protein